MAKLPLILALTLVLTVAGGCAARHPISVEELRPHMSRFFPGVTPEQVVKATEELFLLDDPDDVSFTPTKDGVEVRREYWQSILLSTTKGYYEWNVTTHEKSDGAFVYLTIHRVNTELAFLILPSVRNDPVSESWEFDAYFDRLEFMLGRSTEWTPCKELPFVNYNRTASPTFLSALCWLADDNPPPRLKSLADFEHRSSAALDSSPSAKHGSK